MELVEGKTLEHRLIKGPLPPEQTVRVAAQVADALAKAHKMGFTHRDLKPANIMLTKTAAKLMDFGLANASSSAAWSDVSFRALRPAKPHENDSELRWWRRLERRDRRHNGTIEAVDVSGPERAW